MKWSTNHLKGFFLHTKSSVLYTLMCVTFFNLIFMLPEHDMWWLFSPLSPPLEHSGRLPLWLRPHPQPDGQQDGRRNWDHIGQPVCPSHCCGCQREGGTYHRLPGRLQGDSAQGNYKNNQRGALCKLWCEELCWKYEVTVWHTQKLVSSSGLIWLTSVWYLPVRAQASNPTSLCSPPDISSLFFCQPLEV